jgi:lipopolysaccharide biosynthesis protein
MRLVRALRRRLAPLASHVPRQWRVRPTFADNAEVCLFVTYSPNQKLSDYAAFHARAWAAQGFATVIVMCVDGLLDDFAMDPGFDFASGVLLRENRGYDFSAWASAICDLPELRNARLLVIANDSVFGPLANFPQFVAGLRNSPADFIGATESFEVRRHFQSFILAFGPRALRSQAFWRFWTRVRVGTREQVIDQYETRLLDRFTKSGLIAEALFPREDPQPLNPTLTNWRELIERGFPFIKRQLTRDNPQNANIENWKEYIASKGYDVRLIDSDSSQARGNTG